MANFFTFGKGSPDESTLLEALRRGEDWAYRYLYKNCYPPIKRYVLVQGGSEDDANEVFQEAIIVLFNNLSYPSFELKAKACTYLYPIAIRKWWKINRDQDRHTGYDENPTNPSPYPVDPLDDLPPVGNSMVEWAGDAPYEQDELPSVEDIMEFIINMGEPCTSILRKHYIDEIPLKEMAKAAGISEEAMRKRSFDCRKKVRNHFKNK